MQNRQEHQQEICEFLQKHLSIHDAIFSLPSGSGMETYFVQGAQREYFVKVGASIQSYLTMAEIGLTPHVLASGHLESGLSIIVQPKIKGRKPSQRDYRERLDNVAEIIQTLHNDSKIKEILPTAVSNLHADAGHQALNRLRQKWGRYKSQVPDVVNLIDESLEYLADQIKLFSTEGLAASHNDICNANWLFAEDGKIYLIDFDSMSMDDPALDLGALLWWYYPPALRARFLDIVGDTYDNPLKFRMQVRMSMHCLDITLPRERSFDHFDPAHYAESLGDFKASLAGTENPKGYGGW